MNGYKVKIEFLIMIWLLFFIGRIFLSGGIDLLAFLAANEAPIFQSSFIPITDEMILTFKWLGILVGGGVILGLFRKFFFPLFLISFSFINYLIYLSIGSYGIWAFFFIPLSLLTVYSVTDECEDKKILYYLEVCYVSFYFFAGWSKIYPFWKSVEWIRGYTIENLLSSRQHESILYNTFGLDILSFPDWIIKSGIMGSVLLELSVVLILFSKKSIKIIIPLILMFHFVLFLTGTPGIVEYIFASLIFFPKKYLGCFSYFQRFRYSLKVKYGY